MDARAGPAANPQPGHKWLVFGNHSKLTSDIVSKATQDGGSVTLVHWGQDFARRTGQNLQDRAVRSAALRQASGGAGTRRRSTRPHPASLGDGHDAGRRGPATRGAGARFDSLLNTAKAIQELDLAAPLRLTVVTAGSQAVMGEAVPHPERALALGPCRVIPHEIPNVSTRLIDLAPFDVSSEPAARSSSAKPSTPMKPTWSPIAMASAWHATAHARPEAGAAVGGSWCGRGGVYLITGGLGDIALDLAAFLPASTRRGWRW